jgi:hypothetical protein
VSLVRPAAAFVLAVTGFALLACLYFSFTVDEAYIGLRYGRNLAAGLGPVFDAQPAREGYSSPLWVALASLPFLFHLSTDAAVVALKAAGLACGVATIAITALFVRGMTGSARAAGLAAVLLACMPWMAFWAVGGLETPLYCALLMCGLTAYEGESRRRRVHLLSALPLALLSLTRPEGIAVALAIPAADSLLPSIRRDPTARDALKRAAPAMVIVAACWSVHEVWRIWFFGSAVPTTFLAKAGLSVHDVKTRLLEIVPLFVYVAPLIVAARMGSRRAGTGLTNAAWGALVIQGAFILVPRLEGSPGFRYELPLLPLLVAAAALALAKVSFTRAGPFRRAAMVALVLFLLAPMWWLREPARHSPSAIEIAFARWLSSYAPDARLAVDNLGVIPYYSGAPWVFDTNASGPLSPFLGRAYDVDELLAWSPSFVIMPPETGLDARHTLAPLYSRPAFRRDYVQLFDLDADGYRFTVWTRRDERLRDGAQAAAEAAGLYQRRVSRSTGGSPKYSYALAVATRPRDVRSRKPAWMRNGSWMSSSASRSSLSAAARLPTPTGPPPNFSMIVRSNRRSTSSNP